MTASCIQGFLSRAWNHDIGELPPPKTLEIQSAGINLGELAPSGSPLLHCYDSHWPGAPFLLVPSDHHDEHDSNKPWSTGSFVNSQLVPSLRAQPRVHIQSPPSPQATPTRPTHRQGRESLSSKVTSNTGSNKDFSSFPRLTRLPEAMF